MNKTVRNFSGIIPKRTRVSIRPGYLPATRKNRAIFAGIQSITTKGFLFGKVDLLIIDEAHKVNSADGTSYARLIQDLKTINPNIVILGLSASPYRLIGGLYEGEGRLFDTLYYEIDIVRLINDGYLCPVISKGGVEKIDLSDVRTTAGDYNAKDLEVPRTALY